MGYLRATRPSAQLQWESLVELTGNNPNSHCAGGLDTIYRRIMSDAAHETNQGNAGSRPMEGNVLKWARCSCRRDAFNDKVFSIIISIKGVIRLVVPSPSQ